MGEVCVEALVAALDEARAERDALTAEVKRLKTETGLLAEERDQARETTRCYRNGAEKIQKENEALAAEVGMLKGLLRENLAKGWTKGWEQRAREAANA